MSLLKNIYFQSEDFESIENEELLKFNPEQGSDLLGLEGLLGNLGNVDINGLISMMSQTGNPI